MASHCPESNDAKTRGSLGTGATVQGERIAMTTTVLIADDNAAGRFDWRLNTSSRNQSVSYTSNLPLDVTP
jgi:hypothetical protein